MDCFRVQGIPCIDLSRLSEIVGLLNLSFGTAGLLLALGLDAWRSKSKKYHWIPGDSIVLGALSLQLLGLFYRPILLKYSEEYPGKVIDDNSELLNLGGRVVMCVFFGILLPDVARSHDRNVWSDMLALSIGATGVLIHLFYDIYVRLEWNDGYIDFMFAPSIIIFASIVFLVLLLGCAALASKSIQEFVAHRVRLLLSRTEYRNPGSVVLWEAIEEHAVRSWITVRTHQPQYIIARSVLTSSISFLVTVCVAVSILASTKIGYEAEIDGLDWLRVMAIAAQWIFILFGWAIIFWRWLTAVVYYPRRMGTDGSGLRTYFRVEDFWKAFILEKQEEFMKLDGKSIKRFSYLSRFMFMFLKRLRLYKLMPALLYLQIFLVLLSKTCWLISEMVFSNRYMRRLVMGRAFQVEFSALYNLHKSGDVKRPGNHGDFMNYSDVLMHLPEENPAGVWISNRKSIQEMKAWFKKGECDGKNCKALVSLLGKTATRNLSSTDPFTVYFRRELGDLNVGKSSSKMMVVSLLTIVIELSAFYGFFDGPPTDTVNDCIQACCESWEFIEILENSNPEAVSVNKQADKLFLSLKESRRWLGLPLPINNFQAKTVEAAKKSLHALGDKGKQAANTGGDSMNWKAVIAGNSLYKVCESMENLSVNLEELLDAIQSSLADVMGSCMFKIGEIIVDECRLWAEAFLEDKLWDAFYEAGRAKGVIQQLRPGIKFGRQFEKLHSF